MMQQYPSPMSQQPQEQQDQQGSGVRIEIDGQEVEVPSGLAEFGRQQFGENPTDLAAYFAAAYSEKYRAQLPSLAQAGKISPQVMAANNSLMKGASPGMNSSISKPTPGNSPENPYMQGLKGY